MKKPVRVSTRQLMVYIVLVLATAGVLTAAFVLGQSTRTEYRNELKDRMALTTAKR